jgi:hypothetical protein
MWAEQSPTIPPPLDPAGAENPVETLEKVRFLRLPAMSATEAWHHDQVTSFATMNPSPKNRCFRVLRKVSPSQGFLPDSYYPEWVTLTRTVLYASGGFVDTWKGQRNGNQTFVKAFRTQTVANLNKIKRVCGAILTRVDLA